MGFVVVGLGLLYIVLWYIVLKLIFGAAPDAPQQIASAMLTFGMGASAMALFARVGGGIFTKAADVGADLVGKVEAGIPEDDPRNPAVIADNVGDNVGDVAGMGADLFESYVGAIISAGTLAVAAGMGIAGITVPMVLAAVGIVASVIGTFFVKTKEGAKSEKSAVCSPQGNLYQQHYYGNCSLSGYLFLPWRRPCRAVFLHSVRSCSRRTDRLFYRVLYL